MDELREKYIKICVGFISILVLLVWITKSQMEEIIKQQEEQKAVEMMLLNQQEDDNSAPSQSEPAEEESYGGESPSDSQGSEPDPNPDSGGEL